MSDLHELLTEAWERNPDAESVEIAAEVMGLARTRADLFELALPAVAAQAAVVKRHHVRSVETVAFGQRGLDTQRLPAEAADSTELLDPLTARRQMLAATVYVNHDVGRVLWGEMTAEHHTMRAEYLERKAAGHLQTADRHRLTAKLLDEAGVACLNDLPSLLDQLDEEAA